MRPCRTYRPVLMSLVQRIARGQIFDKHAVKHVKVRVAKNSITFLSKKKEQKSLLDVMNIFTNT